MAKILEGSLYLCFMLLLLLLFNSCMSSLRRYQVQEYHFYSESVPKAFDQYRISLISDIHVWDPHFLQNANARNRQARFDYQRLREISQILQNQQSQLLLLAGDYVSYRRKVRPDFDLKPYFAVLRAARPRDGIVAVLGNHDHFLLPRQDRNLTIQALDASGAQLLVNQQLQIFAPSSRAGSPAQVLRIVGIDDYIFGTRERPEQLLGGLQAKDFVLALAHNPDSFDLFSQPQLIDLAMAGHLHGGQVTLFGFALSVPAQRKYLKQPFQNPDFPVFVSNGLGASRLQIRIMAPPQIWTIILHRGLPAKGSASPSSEPEKTALHAVRTQYPEQPYRLIQASLAFRKTRGK